MCKSGLEAALLSLRGYINHEPLEGYKDRKSSHLPVGDGIGLDHILEVITWK